jgi:hypothetical protein
MFFQHNLHAARVLFLAAVHWPQQPAVFLSEYFFASGISMAALEKLLKN